MNTKGYDSLSHSIHAFFHITRLVKAYHSNKLRTLRISLKFSCLKGMYLRSPR